MAEIDELLLNFVVVALGALAGSAFMWLFIGPIVLKRAGPGVVTGVLRKTFKISDAELTESGDDMMKAITVKQGKNMSQAMWGALGNIVQSAPTPELEALAKKYGYEGVEDAAQKLGGLVPGGLPGAVGGLNPDIAEQLAALNGGKGKNPFGGVVNLMVALNSLSALSPGETGAGPPGVPALQGVVGGGSSLRMSGW